MAKSKKIIRVQSWAELVSLGNLTEEGLYIPMNVCGLKDTRIIFDEDDELEHYKKLAEIQRKKKIGQILSIGNMQ